MTTNSPKPEAAETRGDQVSADPRAISRKDAKKTLSLLVYIERESKFGDIAIVAELPEGKVARFRSIQRAVGMFRETMIEFDRETRTGEIEIDGHRLPCVDVRIDKRADA